MEYEIKVASYKNSKTFFWKWIRFKQKYIDKLWEFSKYSHSEIVFPYYKDDMSDINDVYFQIYKKANFPYDFDEFKFKFKSYKLWFSSSELDRWSRFKFIDDWKGNWDYTTIEVTKEEYLKTLDFCISQEGKKYDYWAIVFAQLFKTFWFYKKDSWFCSEIVTSALQKMHRLCWIDAIMISPWRLAKELFKK